MSVVDKADTNKEYGGTICCHLFRMRKPEYLEGAAENARSEFKKDGCCSVGGFVLGKEAAKAVFTDSENKILEENTVKYKQKRCIYRTVSF